LEPRPYLQWTQAAQIAGSGGCNRFVGQALVTEPEQLRFASLASTRMACMPEPGGQEDKFFVALELTRQARLEGDDLILLDRTGGVLAQLRRVDPKALSHP
jgi:putative lipoprotein